MTEAFMLARDELLWILEVAQEDAGGDEELLAERFLDLLEERWEQQGFKSEERREA